MVPDNLTLKTPNYGNWRKGNSFKIIIYLSIIGFSLSLSLILICFYAKTQAAKNQAELTQEISSIEIKKEDLEKLPSLYFQEATSSTRKIEPKIIQKENPDIDLSPLEKDILKILGDEKENYAVFIKDLQTGETMEINSEIDFYPASIYKVPLAMIVLKDVDQGQIKLEEKHILVEKDLAYSYDPLAKKGSGYEISIEDLLRYLIVASDNTAMLALENILGGENSVQDRIKNELKTENMSRDPHVTNAESVALIFEKIYHQSFLTKESNDFLLNLLINVIAEHNDRIVSPLPEGTLVAHKIGTLLYTYQDAGIIYLEDNPYLLVVLNKNSMVNSAKIKVQEISLATYNFFSSQ